MLVIVILNHLLVGFPTTWETFDLIANIVAMIGLWCFCWEYRLFHRFFWRGFTVAFVGWLLVYEFLIPLPQDVAEINPPIGYEVTVKLVLWGLVAIWVLALYLYSSKKSELWD